ncbi:MAG: hypothetical protein Q4Q58_06190, partial [Thermoplasmata archaeon]|nr:hypothetical protein [Thermoplasmata archaeon]
METNQYGLKRGSRTDSDRLMKYVLVGVSSLAVLIVLLIIVFTVANSWTSITETGIWEFLFGS